MAYLRIHCEACGGVWEVYHRDNWNNDKARQCPHCFAEIDRQTWEKRSYRLSELYMTLMRNYTKDHTGYDKPLFYFDVMTDRPCQNRKE